MKKNGWIIACSIVLIAIAVFVYVSKRNDSVNRSGMYSSNDVMINKPVNFTKQGTLSYKSTGAQDDIIFSYPNGEGEPTTSGVLSFDASSTCQISGSPEFICITMNSLYSQAFGQRPAKLEAVDIIGSQGNPMTVVRKLTVE
jgi:hypothetical protein